MNFVFDLAVHADGWTLESPVSGLRHLESPLGAERFAGFTASLREWASRPVPLDRPDPLGTEVFVQGLARRVSGRLTETLLTEEDRRAVAAALAGGGQVRLILRVRSAGTGWDHAADAALALPWELLAPETEGVYPVREGRLAAEEARSALLEPVGEAGDRVVYPFGWSQLAVYHFARGRLELRSPGLSLPLPVRLELLDASKVLAQRLRFDFDLIHRIGPEVFEMLVMDLVHAMGYSIERPSETFRPDGGIDFVFWKPADPYNLPGAAQVKFHWNRSQKDGPAEIRAFAGALAGRFKQGLFISNTAFTASARFAAHRNPEVVRLRDAEDLKRWSQHDFTHEDPLRDLPAKIEVAPGLWVRLKK